MKRYIYSVQLLLFIFLISHTPAFAQGSVEIVSVPNDGIHSGPTLSADSIPHYPYCTVTISAHNFQKLNSKDYRTSLRKLSSFTVNANIRSKSFQTKDLQMPVFLVNFDKNKYTSITNQQCVLIDRMLLNTSSGDIPSAGVYTKTIDKSSIAFYVGILGQMNSIMKCATSVGWVDKIQNGMSIFSDFLDNISADQESRSEWHFPLVPSNGITIPYAYNMFVLKPDNAPQAHHNFYIQNDEAYVGTTAEIPFTKYPYILVTVSFSDYMSEDGLPSTLACAQLDDLTLAKAKVKLYSMIGRISTTQFDAEENLLQRYTTYLEIKKITEQVPTFKNPDELKTKAIDKYFAYRQIGDGNYYMTKKEAFASRIAQLDDNIKSVIYPLGYFNTLQEAIKAYLEGKYAMQPVTRLSVFHYFTDVTRDIPFIKHSYFSQTVSARIEEAEQRIYEEKYAAPIADMNKLLINKDKGDKDKLQQAKPMYDTLSNMLGRRTECRSCNDSIMKTIAIYDAMENDKATQLKMQLLISCTKYADSLSSKMMVVAEKLKDTTIRADRKQNLSTLWQELDTRIESINRERNAFVNTSLRPKSEFRTQKEKVEAELRNARNLISKASSLHS